MRYHISFFTFVLLISLSSNAFTQTESDKPLYQPTGNEATVVGTISIGGPIPRSMRLDMSADPICENLNTKPETTDDVLVNDNRLRNVLVYVKSEVVQGYRFELPASEATLEHINCMFRPHVLGMRVGQNLRVINADPTHHNTHPTPKFNNEWNQTQSPGSPSIVKTFSQQEVLIPVKDNQHAWQRAYIAVLDHPFFAVSDEFGRFEIRGLPPGTYKLVVWHERFGEKQLELTLVPYEIHNADFTFATEKKPFP